MAPVVIAHQLTSEAEDSIARTPENYVNHVREVLDMWGPFTITIDEVLADGARVYARWTQEGRDRKIDPSRHIRQITSAVFRVCDGLIVEYWIQIDRMGVEVQRQS